jgi:hypothetical protein
MHQPPMCGLRHEKMTSVFAKVGLGLGAAFTDGSARSNHVVLFDSGVRSETIRNHAGTNRYAASACAEPLLTAADRP